MKRVLQSGLRIIPSGEGIPLHYSQRALNLEFEDRVVTLSNRFGVLTPSTLKLDLDSISELKRATFDQNRLITDDFTVELVPPADLRFYVSGTVEPCQVADLLAKSIEERPRSIMSAVFSLRGGKFTHPPSGVEKTIFDYFVKMIQNSTDYNKLAENLIGVGFGLTPSGDDFILGMISICHLFNMNLTGISNTVARYGNSFSRTMLLDGIDGYFPEPHLGVLRAVALGRSAIHEIELLKKVGHTSGSDFIAGAYFAASEFTI